MKLRNKKTGVILHAADLSVLSDYNSLSKINEEWEDYESDEPLIKDEKVRKAVRAWAEAESIPAEGTVFYNSDIFQFVWYRSGIEFSKHIEGLGDFGYTISELCGNEK